MSLHDLHSLLLQAPLSQLPSVIADLRGLLSSPGITGADPRLAKQFEEALPDVLRRFSEQEASVVRLPGHEDGSILAPEGVDAVPPSYAQGALPTTHAYRDEGKLKRFTVDHVSGQAQAGEDYSEGATHDDLRAHLDTQLQAYLRDHYPQLDKYRAAEGACAQVWRQPLRKLKVLTSETQETVQEEAMAQKLTEDRQQARTDLNAKDKDEGRASTPAEEQQRDEKQAQDAKEDAEQTYTPVRDTGAEHIRDTKELRPAESEERGTAKQRDRLPLHDSGENGDDDDDAETHLVEEDDGKPVADSYVVRIVSGKSNAGNFWSGRLLSTYVYTPGQNTLSAKLKIQIHYYENGNVQLNTLAEAKAIPVVVVVAAAAQGAQGAPGAQAQAKAVVAAIRNHEQAYQDVLEDTYAALNHRAFKSLRRQLPVTRQKVDWDKVLNYRLGSDLAGAQSQSAQQHA